MELEEFKHLFNAHTQRMQGESTDSIRKMIHSRGQSAVSRILRNMTLELAFALLLLIGVVVFALLNQNSNLIRGFALFILLVSALQVMYFIPIYKKIKKLGELSSQSLKTWLQQLIDAVESFLRFYKLSLNIGIPISMLFGGYLGSQAANDPTETVGDLIGPPGQISIATASVLVVLSLVAAHYFLKWTIRQLYGRYLDQLKDCLKELED